jgi:putative membrane protein
MKSSFAQLLVRWLVLALGVMIATKIVPGISVAKDGVTLLVVVLLLSFFNAILKPLLVLFTLPFILITMGLGVVVINALLFLLVGRLVEGFQVESFWAALLGSLVVSVTNLLVSALLGGNKPKRPTGERGGQGDSRPPAKRDDVIDI